MKCIFCGNDIEEGKICSNDHSFKKMCINCVHCSNDDANNCICLNKDNQEDKRQKLIEVIKANSSGYTVENLSFDLTPLPIKKTTAHCSRWSLDKDVLATIESLFQ